MMTDKQAYNILLREIECQKRKEHCSRQCSSCSFGVNTMETLEGMGYIKSILKARCPELYFVDEIEIVKEILSNYGNQDKETF